METKLRLFLWTGNSEWREKVVQLKGFCSNWATAPAVWTYSGQRLVTRWSSSYQMVSCLLEVKDSIVQLADGMDWDCLLPSEWQKLAAVRDLLLPFAEHTKMLQSDTMSLSLVVPALLDLSAHLSRFPQSAGEDYISQTIWPQEEDDAYEEEEEGREAPETSPSSKYKSAIKTKVLCQARATKVPETLCFWPSGNASIPSICWAGF